MLTIHFTLLLVVLAVCAESRAIRHKSLHSNDKGHRNLHREQNAALKALHDSAFLSLEQMLASGKSLGKSQFLRNNLINLNSF